MPPVTDEGETTKLSIAAGLTVKAVVLVVSPKVAEIVQATAVSTPIVVIGNGAETAPFGTKTEIGTVTLLLLDDSRTVVPVEGAGPLMVTVPVDPLPPTTEEGETETFTKPPGVIVRLL